MQKLQKNSLFTDDSVENAFVRCFWENIIGECFWENAIGECYWGMLLGKCFVFWVDVFGQIESVGKILCCMTDFEIF